MTVDSSQYRFIALVPINSPILRSGEMVYNVVVCCIGDSKGAVYVEPGNRVACLTTHEEGT